jgi:CheY-like chemotaxis protein
VAPPGKESKLILIVEDEALVAMEMESRVMGLGYAVLGPASTVAQAHALLDRTIPHAALLDVNLRGDMSTPIARRLKDAGVPYALMTGYARLALDDILLAGAQKLSKPVTDTGLATALRMLLAAQAC